MKAILKPTIVLVGGRSLGFAASFFIPIVLARLCGQAEFGTYKQIFLIYGTLSVMVQLGMAESLFYFLPAAPAEAGRFVANALSVLYASGLAAWLLLGAGAPAIARWMNNPALEPYLPLVGAYLFLILGSVALEIVMIARKRYLLAAATYAASDLLKALFYLVPVLVLGDLRGLLLGAAVFGVLRAGVALGYFRSEFGGGLRTDAASLRTQVAYATPYAVAIAVELVQVNFHQYAVSYLFDAATFAVYAVGILQVPLVDLVSSPASNVMMVAMGERLREGDRRGVLEIWHGTIRSLALVLYALTGFMIVGARDIIGLLFTERYLASVPIFTIWSLTVLFATVQVDGVLRALAQTRWLLGLNLARLAATASLLALLVPPFGLRGAVLAAVGGLAFGKITALAVVRRQMGIGIRSLFPWRDLGGITAAVVASGLAASFAARFAAGYGPRVAVAAAVFGCVYLALLLGFDLLRDEEKAYVLGWWSRARSATVKIGA